MSFKRIPKKHCYEVDWVDACSSGRWELLEHVDTEPMCNRSVGYCLKKNRTTIVLAGSLTDYSQSGDRITIPRSCVKAMRKVVIERGES